MKRRDAHRLTTGLVVTSVFSTIELATGHKMSPHGRGGCFHDPSRPIVLIVRLKPPLMRKFNAVAARDRGVPTELPRPSQIPEVLNQAGRHLAFDLQEMVNL